MVLGFTADPEPFFGFYNRGLTLKEGRKAFFPGVEFKIRSRWLEHTLTRDDVLRDQNFEKAMAIVQGLVRERLPETLRGELEELARRASGAAPPPDPLAAEWKRRLPFFHAVRRRAFGRWEADEWPIFPSVGGPPFSAEGLRRGVKAAGGELYAARAASPLAGALRARTIPVLAEGPWAEEAAAVAASRAIVRPSRSWILPEVLPDAALERPLLLFLRTVREMDRTCGARYRDVVAAELDEPGDPPREEIFVVQRAPGALTRVNERPRSSLFGGGRRAFALVNVEHPFVERVAALHASRPGFAAYLLLKVLHLHDGEVPPGEQAKYSNLAETAEGRLLKKALTLDLEMKR